MSIFGGSIGNLVEWYDWYAYSAATIYFAPSFFPKSSQTVQLLYSTSIFALSFLMRPFGSWVLGRYADRRGRKAALTLSVTLMCTGSLLIAITPTYATIGVVPRCCCCLRDSCKVSASAASTARVRPT